MKFSMFGIACLLSLGLQALEYEVQFENDQVCVSRVKIMPKEEIGLHRDVYPQVVIALQGGIITRLEADKRVPVEFPTAVAVFREVDPPNELHKSVNEGSDPVEIITIQLKSNDVVVRSPELR